MAETRMTLQGKSETEQVTRRASGLEFQRRFTDGKISPYDKVEWERRAAIIGNDKGQVIFRQDNVEVPKSWSQTATNIVASKYFHGKPNSPERETSVRQLISRVVETIVRWGDEGGYFSSPESKNAFRDELAHLLVEQKVAFNSPVWFNVGVQAKPQCSACFINSVQDNMDSIMNLAKTEGMLFKWGSGTGTNFSSLRGSHESLSGGGIASGPVSFMKGFDAFAGVIKSGGKTRRAAKMVILNVDHPDIMEFIESKMKEERKAQVLIEQGYDPAIDGEAYSSVFFQNANHSVRVTDDFMRAVEEDRDWWTRNVNDGKAVEQFRARDLLHEMAKSAWKCGDPGMQYDTTINRWHTCKATDRIHASNPCSEYMFLDDTACNLASLNLLKFLSSNGQFDTEGFSHAVDVTITAQEILVDNASYPSEKIARNSHDFRPLGIGYANLGALLMSLAMPYDSDRGRDFCGAITALMTGEAYAQSARIAERMGPFGGYLRNREAMIDVIRMHRDSLRPIKEEHVQPSLLHAAQKSWDDALELGEKFGYKNSQVSVLAPTGTIGFMMDCDTTGIEPDLALVKQKRLVGGGVIKIVNNTVPQSLMNLGYPPEQVAQIVDFIDANGAIEGAPGLKPEHLAVFDCSLATPGGRSISWKGHLKMMAAAQPFLSGAISKTINMPEESTVEDIMEAYGESWKFGLKAVAIYRDNSKGSQPLSVAGKKKEDKPATAPASAAAEATVDKVEVPSHEQQELFDRTKRRKLPNERSSITHKFSIGGHEGYLTVGKYDDGTAGEIFIKMAKEGSTLSGIMDAFALSVSVALQYGVPLRALVDKFVNSRFEPSGYTGNPRIRYAKSVVDYIGRWLGGKFISPDYLDGEVAGGDPTAPIATVTTEAKAPAPVTVMKVPEPEASTRPRAAIDDAPSCSECGMLMTPNGSCYKCSNCGSTSGCS
ncbi:MAG TPA: vitamin B12-dependent ribonucleotide reductase [Candidatus Sulfotelmatobacter sp.]|jgi:ribonucleoside-diphosphate reductase alpha chain|nr:vitamin B12-dependent ribonucleotide reductase [Candidatus Sulfotelmatobacter sp.]